MIKEKQVYVNINSSNYKYFKDLGYENIKCKESILVDIEKLSSGSHTMVTAICEICGAEKKLIYKSYLINKKTNNKYNCHKCCYDEMKISLMSKYGVENISFIPEVKEKIRIKNTENSDERFIKRTKTNLERYGVENTFQSNKLMEGSLLKIKNTNIKNGKWFNYNSDWEKYKAEILSLTRKNKKALFESWNGYDYYDNQYIRDNFILIHSDSGYPNVDHKISIRYGFDNSMTVEEISDVTNLCVTKKCINGNKYIKTENEFILLKNYLRNEKRR